MLAGETGWFVVLQIFKEDNEDAVTSAVLFSSDRQQPPNTATLQRRSDSCDIFWHRESPKSLWQSVSDVQDVFSLQNSAEEEVVRSLSSKTRLIIFFLGQMSEKSWCVWGKVQRNAKRSNKTNNGVEKTQRRFWQDQINISCSFRK